MRPALLLALAATLSAEPVAAQRSSRPPPDSLRHIQLVEPLFGPPGTPVRIFSENLQLEARIWIGIGRVGSGFEVIGEGTQGEWGAVNANVRIPESTSSDRPIILIVLNAIFSPVALSDPFHVTDAEGRITRRGTIVDEGLPCLTLRDQDGYLYALTGAVDDLEAGSSITVTGTYSDSSECGAVSQIRIIEAGRL